jgi:fluoroquinolone transport system permease protein
VIRLRQAEQLLGPVARTLPWRALLAGSATALVVSSLPGSPTLRARLGAVALCLGVAYLFDDPAETTLESSPLTLMLRRALRLALVAPLLAISWWVVLWRTDAPDAVGRTLELGAPLAATLAVAATLGAVAASPVALAFLGADRALPDGWRLFGVGSPDRLWVVVPAVAALVAVGASLDPARRCVLRRRESW